MYLTCCKILGVNPGADIETIKAAYRKSAKELHPDVNPSENAQYYFTILQNAYEYLLEHPFPPNTPTFDDVLKKRNTAGNIRQMYHIRQYSINEILKYSLTARILYIFFHIFFLIIGFYLIFRSIYDILYIGVDSRTNIFAAYISIFAAVLLGIVITTIFVITGYNYIKYRI